MSIITQKLGSTQIQPSDSLQSTAIASVIPKKLPDSIINRISSFTSYDELTHTSHLVCKGWRLPIHVLNLNNSQITDKELIKIIEKEKKSLTHINLSNCKNITDLSLKHFSKLQNLTALNLSECDKITDAGAKDLSKLQNLTALDLNTCGEITDAGAKDLSKLQNLTALNLGGCDKITNAGAKDLSKLQDLTALDLSVCDEITDTGVKALSKLQNLTTLDLSFCPKITDAGAKDLSKLQDLTTLDLSGCKEITDADVTDLSKLQNLTALNLRGCSNITDAGAKDLLNLQHLRALDLSGCDKITNAGAKDLSKLQDLTSLDLSWCKEITDVGVTDLSKLQNLTALNLHGCDKITNAGAKDLSKLQDLTALDLSGCDEITDTGAKALSKLQNLTALNLNYCNKITDAGVKNLSKLQELKKLNLIRCNQITDTGAKALSKLQNLITLDLGECGKITDAGVEDLVNMQQLTWLRLNPEMRDFLATNVKELNAIRQVFVEKTALSQFINEKSRKFRIRKCDLLIKSGEGPMSCCKLPTGCQITIHPLYLLKERDMDSFFSQNLDDQESVETFLIEKRPELLDKAANDLIKWFNSNKRFHVLTTSDNNNTMLAKFILIMHATGKFSASKRFQLTHEMDHAKAFESGRTYDNFPSQLEFNFIKLHQFWEVRADLTAAREENAHDLGIAIFEWLHIIASQPDELDLHPTGENRAKALKIDRDKILKRMTISTS